MGRVRIIAELEGEFDLEDVTQGWTAGERAALRHGDEEAVEAARSEAYGLLLEYGAGEIAVFELHHPNPSEEEAA